MKFPIALFTVALVVFTSSFASAAIIADLDAPASYTLAAVNAAGGIQVGDKVFSDFGVDSTHSVGAIAPAADTVNVTGVQIDGDYGLRFTGLWSAGGLQLADSVIMYKVEAGAPFQITGTTLKMAGYTADNGGHATISTTLYNQDPNLTNTLSVANAGVYFDSGSGTLKELVYKAMADQTNLQPVNLSQVWVLNDVGASGGVDANGISKISAFYQTFTQVPEPATLAVLGLGGLSLLRRRR